MELTETSFDLKTISIPLFGWVTAGKPTDVCDFMENIDVPETLVPNPKRTYALKISGDSMIDEHICEGDIVIVEKTDTAKNGDIVIALIRHTETTIKRFYQNDSTITLKPSNSKMKNIELPSEDVEIQGIVVGVMRKF